MRTMTITMIMLLATCMKATFAENLHRAGNNVSFEIIMDQSIKNTPYILVYEDGIYPSDAARIGQRKVSAKSVKGNIYTFDLKKQLKPLYFSVYLLEGSDTSVILKEFHFEPGDQIRISIKPGRRFPKYTFEFSGTGSAKYQCKNELRMAAANDTAKFKPICLNGVAYNVNNSEIEHIGLFYNVIEKYRPLMSVYSYNLLHADVLGAAGKNICSSMNNLLLSIKGKSDTLAYRKLSDSFSARFTYDFTKNIPQNILSESKEYPQFLVEYFMAKSSMQFGYINYKTYFNAIKEEKNPVLRDKLILHFFTRYWSRMGQDLDYCLDNSLKLIADSSVLERVSAFKNNRTGSDAYNFSLRDINGNAITLKDFAGKVIFIDFWYTGCGACMKYFDNVLKNVEKKYANNPEVVFITISTDTSEIWKESLKKGKHTSADIVNLYTNDQGYFHDIVKYYNIRSYPRPMVISRQGKIACIDNDKLRNFDGLVSAIDHELALAK